MNDTRQGLLESTQQESSRFGNSFLPGLLFVGLIWLIHLLAYLSDAELGFLGIYPRRFYGLVGVFLGPLLHGDLKHLLSNTFPLVLLSGFILFIHRREGAKVIALVYLLSGVLTWFIGRQAHHIGASGVVYGMAGYLLFRGIITRDRGAMAVAFAVLFMYSGLFYGLFPNEERISWEGHLGGLIAGLVGALLYGQKPVATLYNKESSVKVQPNITERHTTNTFVPYYLHYTINYSITPPDKVKDPYTYTITPDKPAGQQPTRHQYSASVSKIKTQSHGNR